MLAQKIRFALTHKQLKKVKLGAMSVAQFACLLDELRQLREQQVKSLTSG